MTRSFTIFATAFLFLFSCMILSGKAKAQEGRLSENEAVRLAVERSAGIADSNRMLKVARYNLSGAGWVDNPTLRLDDISSDYFEEGFDEFSVSLRWSVPRLGELDADEQRARTRLLDKRAEAANYRIEFAASIRRCFVAVEIGRRMVKLGAELFDIEKRRGEAVKAMVELGELSPVRLAKANRRLSRAKSDLQEYSESAQAARRRLALQTGVDVDNLLLAEPERLSDSMLKELISNAKRRSPDRTLRIQRKRQMYAKAYENRMRAVPWFSIIELSYNYERDKRDWGGLMLGFDLPLFNWHLDHARAAELLEKSGLDSTPGHDADLEMRIRFAGERYIDLYDKYQKSKEQNVLFDADLLGMQKSAARHNSLAADDLLDLAAMRVSARMELLEIFRDLHMARIDLNALSFMDVGSEP